MDEPSAHVRARMQTQPRVDTLPELQLRRELYRRGLRYRIGMRVPGRPRRTIDIAFPGKRVAVFVDGCFWHRCPEHAVPAKNNADWWAAKLQANVERDRDTTALLEAQNWLVLRFWEHEAVSEAADAVMRAVRGAALPK